MLVFTKSRTTTNVELFLGISWDTSNANITTKELEVLTENLHSVVTNN